MTQKPCDELQADLVRLPSEKAIKAFFIVFLVFLVLFGLTFPAIVVASMQGAGSDIKDFLIGLSMSFCLMMVICLAVYSINKSNRKSVMKQMTEGKCQMP